MPFYFSIGYLNDVSILANEIQVFNYPKNEITFLNETTKTE